VDLKDKCAVVTGGANGIGAALCRRFAAAGVRTLVVADLDEANARAVAEEVGGTPALLDVRSPTAIAALVEHIWSDTAPIDLFCSNAGIAVAGGPETADAQWTACWEVNVMAHVWAARALVPRMLARGGGTLLNTCSAAGLLTQIGSASYSVTKHAAVGFAEWLAITYGGQGLRVSVLCPQAVRTQMTAGSEGGGVAGVNGMMEPPEVAEAVVLGLREERFQILPHPEVHEYVLRKASDIDRWIGGMQRLQARFSADGMHRKG